MNTVRAFIEPEILHLGKQISNPPDLPKRYFLTKVGTYDYIEKAPFEVTITVELEISDDVILHILVARGWMLT